MSNVEVWLKDKRCIFIWWHSSTF